MDWGGVLFTSLRIWYLWGSTIFGSKRLIKVSHFFTQRHYTLYICTVCDIVQWFHWLEHRQDQNPKLPLAIRPREAIYLWFSEASLKHHEVGLWCMQITCLCTWWIHDGWELCRHRIVFKFCSIWFIIWRQSKANCYYCMLG